MTLEELGKDYLLQAEAMLDLVERQKQKVIEAERTGVNLPAEKHRLFVIQNNYEELYSTGRQLLNYYKK